MKNIITIIDLKIINYIPNFIPKDNSSKEYCRSNYKNYLDYIFEQYRIGHLEYEVCKIEHLYYLKFNFTPKVRSMEEDCPDNYKCYLDHILNQHKINNKKL